MPVCFKGILENKDRKYGGGGGGGNTCIADIQVLIQSMENADVE